ncbi:bolA-like protein 3 [Culicoides brevitarsis]|uniref:bolA-like protein 3 n=1 Tax=Culicoides brevitarsis TaxID=469753 RepID=UPI00307C62CB
MLKNIFRGPGSRYISLFSRVWSGNSTQATSNNSEEVLKKILEERFPKADRVKVEDVSGGCGAMYEIFVESVEFKGLNTVKQHKLITEALKEQIKEMHGLRIRTSIPIGK